MDYQVVTSLLCRSCLTRHRFCQLCEVVNYNQSLVIPRLRHADLLMVYLHHFMKFRAFHRLEWEFHLPWVFHLQACQACIHPPLASFPQSWSIEPVKYSMLHPVYPLVPHLIVRSEQHLCLIQLR